MNIKEIEKELNKDKLLKLKGFKPPKEMNLKSFIIDFIRNYNKVFSTLQGNSSYCPPGCKRSLGDIYRICKFYFKDCRLKNIIEILYNDELMQSNKIYTNVCSSIYKRVWGTSSGYAYPATRSTYGFKDEYGNKREDYLGELS